MEFCLHSGLHTCLFRRLLGEEGAKFSHRSCFRCLWSGRGEAVPFRFFNQVLVRLLLGGDNHQLRYAVDGLGGWW